MEKKNLAKLISAFTAGAVAGGYMMDSGKSVPYVTNPELSEYNRLNDDNMCMQRAYNMHFEELDLNNDGKKEVYLVVDDFQHKNYELYSMVRRSHDRGDGYACSMDNPLELKLSASPMYNDVMPNGEMLPKDEPQFRDHKYD